MSLAAARALHLVAGPGETLYVLSASGRDWHLFRTDDGGQTFAPPVLVTGGTHAEVLPVVRPALAVREDGLLASAWVAMGSAGLSRLHAAFSEDGGQSFTEPLTLAETRDPETTMATVAFDSAGEALVTWLQNSTLRLTVVDGTTHAAEEAQVVDDLVCECCQPAPLALDDQVFVAYRNLIRDDAGVATRDIHVSASTGGAFAEPVKASDGAWPIDACPIAGPALAAHEGTLYAAWMDGRFDDGTLSRTDIWLAASADGGLTFGPNIRANTEEGGYNGQPSLVLDPAGNLHVAWVADTATGPVLLYTISGDAGQAFVSPRAVVTGAGRLSSVQLAVTTSGQVYVAWIDSGGGHVQPLE